MKFEIPQLPYPKDALAPHITEQTVELHYEKHHKGYLRKLKDAIEGTPLAEQSLEDIICATGDPHVFNVAAQVWNHTFYWNSLSPEGHSEPTGALADAVDRDFGSLEALQRRLADAANGEFGSGWAWLLKNRDGRLKVTSSSDADNPVRSGSKPLLTIDVWEHAYYLDYQNERNRYVDAVIEELLNWRFAEKNYGG
jgi:Fe-Mn family superoxide dismutase